MIGFVFFNYFLNKGNYLHRLTLGKPLRSIYAYSPVLSLDRRKGVLVSGSEGGKVELWDLEVGEGICSTRNTDHDDAVTCVKVSNTIKEGGFLKDENWVFYAKKTFL